MANAIVKYSHVLKVNLKLEYCKDQIIFESGKTMKDIKIDK